MGLFYSLNLHKVKEQYQPTDELSVNVTYYFRGKKIKVSTEVKVKLKDWGNSGTNPVLKSDPEYKSKNILLKSHYSQIEGIINKIIINEQNPEVSLVKQYLRGVQIKKTTKTGRDVDYQVLLKDYLKMLSENVVLSKNYTRNVINSLNQIKYCIDEKYKNMTFLVSNFDEDFQNEYKNYSVEKHQRNNPTIHKHLKHLGGFMKWCLKNQYIDFPFTLIRIPLFSTEEVIYLQRDEIEEIFKFKDFDFNSPNHKNYTNEYVTDTKKNGKEVTYTNLEVYKDMLLFGCGVGCRFGDLVNLKLDNYEFGLNRNTGFFIFRMEKTRKQIKVPMNQLTFEIWKKYSNGKSREDYIFPRTSYGNPVSNQKMNDNLKVIGRIVKLERLVKKPIYNSDGTVREGTDIRKPLHNFLTSHIIRRTFIREGLNSGLPRHLIMEMSGHSTEKEFGKYYSVIDSEREKMSSLFSFDLLTTNEKKEEPKSINEDLTSKLFKIKELFEQGLIPKDIYDQKVSDLLNQLN